MSDEAWEKSRKQRKVRRKALRDVRDQGDVIGGAWVMRVREGLVKDGLITGKGSRRWELTAAGREWMEAYDAENLKEQAEWERTYKKDE